MNLREFGQGGREAGARIGANWRTKMGEAIAGIRRLYPTMEGIDLTVAVSDYDRERLACEPGYGKFPEMRGLLDRHMGEREGFREVSGLDETDAAFHFSWGFFLSRRINASHVARYDLLPPPPTHCTNVFFPEGRE